MTAVHLKVMTKIKTGRLTSSANILQVKMLLKIFVDDILDCLA